VTAVRLIQRKRIKGWRKPPGAISISRPGKYGNPFSVSELGMIRSLRLYRNACQGFWLPSDAPQDERFDAVYEQYTEFMRRFRLEGWPHPMDAIRTELTGRILMDWCGDWEPGQPEIDCHGVPLLKLANGLGR